MTAVLVDRTVVLAQVPRTASAHRAAAAVAVAVATEAVVAMADAADMLVPIAVARAANDSL